MGAIAKFEQKQKVLQDFFFKSTCLELQCIFIAVETTNMNLAYKCAWFLNGLYKYSKTIKKLHIYTKCQLVILVRFARDQPQISNVYILQNNPK